MFKVREDGVFYDFGISCYYDIYKCLESIYNEIKMPIESTKRDNYVFDEDRSVRWNREQVAQYNAALKAKKESIDRIRAESLRNLDLDIIEYMLEYEANASTPRRVIEKVLVAAQTDHDDDWWNYLSTYLSFAETIIEVMRENT